MPFIEDVEEAREKLAALNMEIAGEQLDPENEQDNADCNLIADEPHPDYETQNPDFFHGDDLPPRAHPVSYRKVGLWDNNKIRSEIRKLDPDQRYVLDLYVKYARALRLAEKFGSFPVPLLHVVEGDAGSGKSELIKQLSHVMDKEFMKPGDDPEEQPYVLRGAFTGEAANNI